MPYATLDELPTEIRRDMPEQAQQIYMAAYNRVWEKEHLMPEPGDNRSTEERAHEAALTAVQAQFGRDEHGRWRPDPIGEDIDETRMRDSR